MALKLQFLQQIGKNHPAAGGSATSVTRLNCNDLFSTGPKLNNFCPKKHLLLVQAALSLTKTLIALQVTFTPADKFFKRLYGQHTKRAINAAGLVRLFFQK